MTKLVQYIGSADEKTISSAELASHGITSPDLVFIKDAGDDYFKPVPDVVAVFLLSQGDFRAYDGSTILDIFENNASPEAEPEVLSVQIGDDEPMDGLVVLPAGGSGAQHALRKLGYDAGEAMPGDDNVRVQAVRTTLFSGDGREVLVANDEGTLTALSLPVGTLLASTGDGMVAITYAELEALIETGGEGLAFGNLSDTDVTSAVDGYVATYVESTGKITLRPIPTLPVHVTLSGGRFGVVSPPVNGDGYVDLSANPTNLVFEIDASVTVNLMLPAPEFGALMIVKFITTDPTATVNVHIDGDPTPAFILEATPNEYMFAFPVQEEVEEDFVPTWRIAGVSEAGSGGDVLLPPHEFLASGPLAPEQVNFMVVNNSVDPVYLDVPLDLDVPVGTRFHLLRHGTGEFGLWPIDIGVTMTSAAGLRGINPFGEATLWKRNTNDFVLYGDLVAIDPPP